IVALDMPAKGWPSRQIGQSRRVGKGACANDGIVAPVVPAPLVPRREACRYDWAVEGNRELLQSCKQGLGLDQTRHRLNEADASVGCQRRLQFHDQRSRHDAVCIKYDEALVGSAKTPDPIGYVARLLVDIFRARSVKQADLVPQRLAQEADRPQLARLSL